MMALAPNVASKKIYGANLPQGLHMNLPKSARTSFQWKKMKQFQIDVLSSIQVWFSSPLLYTIIAIHLVINDAMRFFTIGNLDFHYFTTSSGWVMLKNVQRPPGVFWIKNPRKCMVATKCFLYRKSQKMFGDHQAFYGWKMVENVQWLLGVFQLENVRKHLAVVKRFWIENSNKCVVIAQQLLRIFQMENARKCLMHAMCFLDTKCQKTPGSCQAFFR